MTEIFDEILLNIYNPETITWEYAAKNGKLSIIHFLHRNNIGYYTSDIMNIAAQNGHIEIVKFLYENYKNCIYPIDYAAMNGHLDIVKWFCHNTDELFTIRAIQWAAKNQHYNVIKWLAKDESLNKLEIN